MVTRPFRSLLVGDRFRHWISGGRWGPKFIGFSAPNDPLTCLCLARGTVLELRLPALLRERFEARARERVEFAGIGVGGCLDGIRFAGNLEVTLEDLGIGVTAQILSIPGEPRAAPLVRGAERDSSAATPPPPRASRAP